MSLPESSSDRPRGVLVRRTQSSIYTLLLFVAVVSLLIACAIMAWEMLQYDLQWKPPTTMRTAASTIVFESRVV